MAVLIKEGSTLQIGLGTILAAVLRALKRHCDLGIHSGRIGDQVVDLAEAGVPTNARKPVDRGCSVSALLSGGPRLMKWADGNATLRVRPTSYTHDFAVLSSIDRFVAINSAIEVDLTGQINAFLRGAHASRCGSPIVALPSTAGGRSRIVASLSGPTSTSRPDAGLIVTEHGVADRHGLRRR